MSVNPVAVMNTITTTVNAIVMAAPLIQKGIVNVQPAISTLYNMATGNGVTEEQLVELQAHNDDLHRQIQKLLRDKGLLPDAGAAG